ncbi:MAG: hypothetical protein K9L02_01955 [Acholeplasmataceae bacterium]|nr:hypothetical protein [Acholeplasmataceae bacterium]
MERSKSRKVLMTYMMVMQVIFSIIGLSLLGIYIGSKIDSEGDLSTILGAIGLILGIIVGFITIMQFVKSEERYERRT